MAEDDQPYEVGYGKPPRSSQFQKGRSGNPKGRPKGAKSFFTEFIEEVNQKINLNGPRGQRRVTKARAAAMQIANKAAQGDIRAFREVAALIRLAEESAATSGATPQLSELDRPTLENIRRRISRTVDTDQKEQQ